MINPAATPTNDRVETHRHRYPHAYMSITDQDQNLRRRRKKKSLCLSTKALMYMYTSTDIYWLFSLNFAEKVGILAKSRKKVGQFKKVGKK